MRIIYYFINSVKKTSDKSRQYAIWVKGNVIFEAKLNNEIGFFNEKPLLVS